MKSLTLIVLTLFLGVPLGSTALAFDGQRVEAPGKVLYKMPDGQLVTREATLSVPARGEGELYLRSGDSQVTAHKFFTKKKKGRTIFYVIFLNPPHAPENTVLVFKGTYLRGTNEAYYYGDFYSKVHDSPEELQQNQQSLDQEKLSERKLLKGLKHGGGFYFRAEVTQTK